MVKAKPKFTQRMTLHLNGGSDFSRLNYDVMRNDKQTVIKRYMVTDGSPDYKKTQDIFVASHGKDDHIWDVLVQKADGLEDWLEKHYKPKKAKKVTA